jgi:hypothetical protein
MKIFSNTEKLLNDIAQLLSSWPARIALLLLELWEAFPQPGAHLFLTKDGFAR